MAASITRRHFALGATAIATAPTSARAQARGRLVVGTWGGDSQKVLEDYVAAPHLRPAGIDTVFDAAPATSRKVKLLAERALPRGSLDVAGFTDADAYLLWKNGVVEDIDYSQIKSADRIIPSLRKPYMIPQFFSTRVIIYNPQKVTETPTSFADLWNPKYAGRVGLIDIQYLPTIETAAFVNGGSQSNFEPGKEKLLELKKMGMKVYPTNEAMAQALQSGECWICFMWQARAVMWQNAGIPIKFVFPKEGYYLYLAGFTIPKNARNKNAAYQFLNTSLQTDTQTGFANSFGFNPPVTGVDLPSDYQARIGVPPGAEDKLQFQDNEYILANDAQLKDWWDKVLKA
ncbi:extracellular solute-binding protein [Bosea vestrisii]|uniref:ABC transporter substrate-binding protein n=1 Tax=Bosea vestrisii TaxID=151416 RepID=UPI0024E02812|nr:extracellular solute-binding protein [Bosea vestrisii]WID95205.1 extracellular solute-binding protein [Bosea vestrisii]